MRGGRHSAIAGAAALALLAAPDARGNDRPTREADGERSPRERVEGAATAPSPAPAPTRTTDPSDGSDEVGSPTRASTTETSWYGWQTLLLDTTSVLVIAASGGPGGLDSAGRTLGLGALVFGAPIIHAAHGNWGIAAGSLFGLRIGMPIGLGALGALYFERPDCDFCALGGFVIGAALGGVTAVIADAAIATEERPAERRVARGGAVGVGLVPWVDRTRRGASIAVSF